MLVGEELNWGCSGIGTSIGANGLAAGPILIAGTDEQKKQWLGPLVEAPILGCFGLTEPGAGSDVSGIQTTAVRRGDEYVINGSKMFITNAGPRVVDRLLRLHRPQQGARGPLGLRRPDGHARRHDREAPRQDGPARDGHVGSRLPGRRRARARTGSAPRATASRSRCRRSTSRGPGTAVGAVGVAQAAFELSVEYTKERVQFGMPIAMNQGVSFLVADMATEIEAARLLTWQAAWMIDAGLGPQGDEVLVVRQALRRRHGDEGDDRRRAGLRRLRLHEGVPVEKLMRDAKLFQIYEGTSQIQRLVIAKEIYLG